MSVLGVSIMTSYIMHIYAQAYIVMCLSCQGGRPEWLSDVSRTVIFPDIYDSRTDDSRTGRFPDRRFPGRDKTTPGQTFPGHYAFQAPFSRKRFQ